MLQIISCTHTHERICKSCVARNWAIRTGKRVIDIPHPAQLARLTGKAVL